MLLGGTQTFLQMCPLPLHECSRTLLVKSQPNYKLFEIFIDAMTMAEGGASTTLPVFFLITYRVCSKDKNI